MTVAFLYTDTEFNLQIGQYKRWTLTDNKIEQW